VGHLDFHILGAEVARIIAKWFQWRFGGFRGVGVISSGKIHLEFAVGCFDWRLLLSCCESFIIPTVYS
jgi:hypothetical protein